MDELTTKMNDELEAANDALDKAGVLQIGTLAQRIEILADRALSMEKELFAMKAVSA